MSGPLVVVGDTLLDVDVLGTVERQCPDAAAPVLDVQKEVYGAGGAGLAAVLARHLCDVASVRLVTALADDSGGRRLHVLLDGVVDLVACTASATTEKRRLRTPERVIARVDSARGRPGPVSVEMIAAIEGAGAVLVSDYGLGITGDPRIRKALASAAARVPLVWDPHPRGAAPVPRVGVATPNLAEAAGALGWTAGGDGSDAPGDGAGVTAARRAAGLLRDRWSAVAVAVTVGAHGAVLANGSGSARLVAAPTTPVVDPCGAGDAFAAALTSRLLGGAELRAAVAYAVATASAFLGDGGVSVLRTRDHPAVSEGVTS